MKLEPLLPVTFDGKTAHKKADVFALFGVSYGAYQMRIRRGGMTPEQALSTPYSRKRASVGKETVEAHGYVLEKATKEEAAMFQKDGSKRLNRWIRQHRLVWCRHHGRALRDHENVHHINGDRADNRIENLELWSTAQPQGQRVADKVKYAREILDMYGDEFPE